MFGDFLVEQYGKHGVNTQELLEAQMAKLNTTDEAIAYEELVADACQTMLLDSNAVEKLAELRHKDKGLFEKIREFIRSILDKLRKDYAGIDPNSEEAKALRSMTDIMEQMTALFEDAAVDAAQAHSQAADGRQTGEVKFQKRSAAGIEPQDVEQLRSIGRKSVNEFTGEEIQRTEKWARKFYRELGTKSPFFRAWFGDWRAQDTGSVQKISVSNLNLDDVLATMHRGTVKNTDSKWDINVGSVGARDTVSHSGREKISAKMLSEIQQIIENAVLLDTETSQKSSNKKHSETAWMHKLYAYVDYNGAPYIAKVTVEEYGASESADRRFYNLRGIKIEPAGGAPDANASYGTMPDTDSTISISGLYSLVKQFDKDFHPGKTVSPALLNADGTPKAFYHGTADEITQFVSEKRGSNTEAESAKLAFFFTDSEAVASGYAADARPEWIEDLRKKAERLDSRAQITGKFAEAEAAYSAYEEAEIAYDSSGIVMPVYISLKSPYVYDFKGQKYREKTYYDIIKKAQEAGHDGVVFQNTYDASNNATDEMNTVCAVFNSADIKSTDNIGTFDGSDPDIRYSKRGSNERYTYESLVSKPDMTVTELTGKVPGNRADVVYEAKMNAAKIGKFNPKDGSVSVHVEDIDADVVLGTYGLRHGLDRRFAINAPITLQAGSILKNSIQINELTAQKKEADSSYILIGAATDSNHNLYIVRSVINKFSSELTSMDVLYALNAKKGDLAVLNAPEVSRPLTSPNISISTLLDFVNQYFPDILPEEVLKHYGHTARPEGDLGQSALYSTRNKSNRELLTEALETTVDTTTPMGQYEAKLLGQYKENIGRLDELQAHLKEVNAEIRALTFGDAPRDPQRLRALKDEKIKTENRIDIYDKKLLRLEATSPLKSVLEREKKRVKQETVTAFRESTKAQKTKSETRGKLKQIIRSLDQLLTHGTKERNVKADMQETVGAALSLANAIFNDELTNEDIVRMGAQMGSCRQMEKVPPSFIRKRKSLDVSVPVVGCTICRCKAADIPRGADHRSRRIGTAPSPGMPGITLY